MPTTNQFKTAWIDTSPVQRTAQYDALSKRGAYVIVAGENATDLIPPPLATHLIYNGLVFWYDGADATTAHDGVTCIVTFDAKRFKTDAYNGRGILTYAVKDKDLAAPPGSPALGDAYIVAAGGTGAWATKDKKIAVWTARSWVFIQPNAYWEAFVIDESLYYHYSAGGAWTSGLPGIVLPAGGVRIGNLKYGLGLRVFNQTTTAPPGSPAEGDAYIVGTGGTGAWAGHDRKLAIWETAAWTILVPVDGWMVYDTALNRPLWYDTSAWADPLVIAASNLMVLLATLPATSGTSLSYTGIPAGYREMYIEVDAVSLAGLNNLSVAVSGDGGATYGTAELITPNLVAAADTFNGSLALKNILIPQRFAPVSICAVTRSSDGAMIGATTKMVGKAVSGGGSRVNAVQFQAASAFDGGEFRIFAFRP